MDTDQRKNEAKQSVPIGYLRLSVAALERDLKQTGFRKEKALAGFGPPGASGKDSYGEISIRTDGTEKGKFRWGGSGCQIGTAVNPPKEIEPKGNTKVVPYYGIAEMHPDTGEGIRLKKGKLQPGDFHAVFAEKGFRHLSESGFARREWLRTQHLLSARSG